MDILAHAERLAAHVTVVRRDTDGRLPVVVQMHGCGGVLPMQFTYAEAARDVGVAAVVLDSFAPRGIGRREAQLTVCSGLKFRGAERAVDLVAALRWLQDQPWADPDRIAVAGWSHGGWAIMEALTQTSPATAAEADVLARLKAAILICPYAGPLSRTARRGWGANRPTVYACLGGRDAVVGRTLPERALKRLEDDGLTVNRLFLPEATHSFDDPDANDPRTQYRPDLAEQARAFYVAALTEALA
jgi:dienelactone hydrolase